jgi:hypothetical protein
VKRLALLALAACAGPRFHQVATVADPNPVSIDASS